MPPHLFCSTHIMNRHINMTSIYKYQHLTYMSRELPPHRQFKTLSSSRGKYCARKHFIKALGKIQEALKTKQANIHNKNQIREQNHVLQAGTFYIKRWMLGTGDQIKKAKQPQPCAWIMQRNCPNHNRISVVLDKDRMWFWFNVLAMFNVMEI